MSQVWSKSKRNLKLTQGKLVFAVADFEQSKNDIFETLICANW